MLNVFHFVKNLIKYFHQLLLNSVQIYVQYKTVARSLSMERHRDGDCELSGIKLKNKSGVRASFYIKANQLPDCFVLTANLCFSVYSWSMHVNSTKTIHKYSVFNRPNDGLDRCHDWFVCIIGMQLVLQFDMATRNSIISLSSTEGNTYYHVIKFDS